ncbi:MAG: SDR family NAD(P)-dependent oxidoreductase, partial [Conexivisphaera sp.]
MSWGSLEEVPEEVSPEVHRRNTTPPCNRFANQKVLVTGAGRGLGSRIAVAFARDGADVAVHYNTSAEGAEK